MASNTNTSALLEMISRDVLSFSIFPFLADSPKKLVDYMCVCRGFQRAADHPSVWKALAISRYGEAIACATIETAIQELKLYASLKEAILTDDNAQMAIPTIRAPKVCNWRRNWRHNGMPHAHYCCIIQGVKWDRTSSQVRIYLDVRGENDLRPPEQSHIMSLNSETYSTPSASWHSVFLPSEQRPGHFKGYLVIPEHVFHHSTIYYFRYSAVFNDYTPVEIFNLTSNRFQELFELQKTTPAFTLRDDYGTPDSAVAIFEIESAAEERGRWESFVPAHVLDRRRGEPNAWWAEEPEESSGNSS